ncbi:hypothetical protein [Intestinimonas butyriciproducens]|uniref:hypothetical protein n=1 Tax=Intestinimonas butyriciproducens TaxID=1297617 RepID=UPI0034A5A1F0
MLNVARAVRPSAPGVLDAEWRAVGTPLRLRDHPRNVRAEVQQRTRARRKIFQRVCSCLMGLSFLLLIGFTGGVERGGDLVAGAIGMGLSLAGFALFGTLAGIVQW